VRGTQKTVWVHVAQDSYESGDPVLVTLYNNQPRPIHLQGCNSFILERNESGRWVERHLKRCVWEGEAVTIAALDRLEFDLEIETSRDLQGKYRVKIPYWGGCGRPADGRPVSELGCEKELWVYSDEFAIR
jgi:hypothetical protein